MDFIDSIQEGFLVGFVGTEDFSISFFEVGSSEKFGNAKVFSSFTAVVKCVILSARGTFDILRSFLFVMIPSRDPVMGLMFILTAVLWSSWCLGLHFWSICVLLLKRLSVSGTFARASSF